MLNTSDAMKGTLAAMSCGAKVNQETYWRSKEGRDGGVRGVDAKEGRKAALRSIVRVPLINLHGRKE